MLTNFRCTVLLEKLCDIRSYKHLTEQTSRQKQTLSYWNITGGNTQIAHTAKIPSTLK